MNVKAAVTTIVNTAVFKVTVNVMAVKNGMRRILMSNSDKIQVGMTVYLNPVARYNGTKIVEATVVKKGRKYFYVAGKGVAGGAKFSLETLREVNDYQVGWTFYFDKQTILDNQERANLRNYIRTVTRPLDGKIDSLSIDQLKRVKAIFEEVK
jgi:hypothetical protein